MSYRATFLLMMLINPVFAQETIAFKKELTTQVSWFSYTLILIALLVFLLILSHYFKKGSPAQVNNPILKRIGAHHKTSIYVVDYQGQQFLLAENQNALALHPLKEVKSQHEE